MSNAISELLEALRSKLPAASRVIVEGAATAGSQASLRGDPAHVRRAVAAIPNTSNHFPSRESYLGIGYAIKAALPDDPEAFGIWADWCERWTDGENDPEIVAADWRRMRPPFKRGAPWLIEQATELGLDFSVAALWHEPITETAPLFPDDAPAGSDVYPLLRMGDLLDRPPPVWLLQRHIPQMSMGFLYSVPGAGKSFLALDMALHMAYGLEAWHGDALSADRQTVVIYIASEGSFGFRNRIRAWKQAHNIADNSDRFLLIERTINFMRLDDIERLLRTVRSLVGQRPCLIIVDTVSRAMPGADENLQKEMTLFVAACDRLKEAFGCAVLGVHHAGKNGDMRGSTVLLGAGDFVFRLERRSGATIGDLHCEKQKDAPDGWEEPYRFDTIDLGDGESSLVPMRCDVSMGPELVLTPATSALVLEAMRAAWIGEEPWSKVPQAGERFAVRRMVADFGFKAAAAGELLTLWEQSGMIRVGTASARRRKLGYEVVGAVSAPASTGVFD